MSMGCLQACGFFAEQMPSKVTIDINMFLKAFSIKVDNQLVHPPSWVQNNDKSVIIMPSSPTSSTPPSEPSLPSPTVFDMDHYRTCRQAEALCWINLQEKRASIISSIQPTLAEDYQKWRDTIMSESEPFQRKLKKKGMKICSYSIQAEHSYPFIKPAKKLTSQKQNNDNPSKVVCNPSDLLKKR
jgi:hypothetical protein